MIEDRANLFNMLRGIESDAAFRSRILQTIKDDGRWLLWPATFADIQTAIGADLDRLAAHLDLERKSNV